MVVLLPASKNTMMKRRRSRPETRTESRRRWLLEQHDDVNGTNSVANGNKPPVAR
jgi:hypothetical protein